MSKSKKGPAKNIVKLYCKTPNESESDTDREYSEITQNMSFKN